MSGYFIGRFLRLGRALIARGFGGESAPAPAATGLVPYVVTVTLSPAVAAHARIMPTYAVAASLDPAVSVDATLTIPYVPRTVR